MSDEEVGPAPQSYSDNNEGQNECRDDINFQRPIDVVSLSSQKNESVKSRTRKNISRRSPAFIFCYSSSDVTPKTNYNVSPRVSAIKTLFCNDTESREKEVEMRGNVEPSIKNEDKTQISENNESFQGNSAESIINKDCLEKDEKECVNENFMQNKEMQPISFGEAELIKDNKKLSVEHDKQCFIDEEQSACETQQFADKNKNGNHLQIGKEQLSVENQSAMEIDNGLVKENEIHMDGERQHPLENAYIVNAEEIAHIENECSIIANEMLQSSPRNHPSLEHEKEFNVINIETHCPGELIMDDERQFTDDKMSVVGTNNKSAEDQHKGQDESKDAEPLRRRSNRIRDRETKRETEQAKHLTKVKKNDSQGENLLTKEQSAPISNPSQVERNSQSKFENTDEAIASEIANSLNETTNQADDVNSNSKKQKKLSSHKHDKVYKSDNNDRSHRNDKNRNYKGDKDGKINRSSKNDKTFKGDKSTKIHKSDENSKNDKKKNIEKEAHYSRKKKGVSYSTNEGIEKDSDDGSPNSDTTEDLRHSASKQLSGMCIEVLESQTLQNPILSEISSENKDDTCLSDNSNKDQPVKPEKVKSRWWRSSKMEDIQDSNACDKGTAAETCPSQNAEESQISESTEQYAVLEEEISIEVTTEKMQVNTSTEEHCKESSPPAFEIIEENIYRFERKRSKSKKEVRRMVCDCTLTKEEQERNVLGCTEECLNRLLMIECGSRCPIGEACSNKKFQKREYIKAETFQTENKGWGLQALQNILVGDFVMEFVGEVLNHREFRQRVKQYARDKNVHYYFMALKTEEIIDATYKGNPSRFINHSCNPNCETQKWTVNGELRIGFFAKRNIQAGEELTFDYQFQRYGREAQKCYCGSDNCSGFIGGSKQISLDAYSSKSKKRKGAEDKKRDWEDLTLAEEIEKLNGVKGLRNREETLKLARLMVHADDGASRHQLLNIIIRTEEQACLRLFLDYHGLSLMWSWMADGIDMALKCKILHVLSLLPITNKTVLLDSKVMNVVEKWHIDAKENKQASLGDPVAPKNVTCATAVSTANGNSETEVKKIKLTDFSDSETDSSVSQHTPDTNFQENDPSLTELSKVPAPVEEFQEAIVAKPDEISDAKSTNAEMIQKNEEEKSLKMCIEELSSELLNTWKNLKEVFRIPRLEQQKRKEDEQEADRKIENEDQTEGKIHSAAIPVLISPCKYSCFSQDEEAYQFDGDQNISKLLEEGARPKMSQSFPTLSKQKRRHLFAMKMKKKEEEMALKKQREEASSESTSPLLSNIPAIHGAVQQPGKRITLLQTPGFEHPLGFPLNQAVDPTQMMCSPQLMYPQNQATYRGPVPPVIPGVSPPLGPASCLPVNPGPDYMLQPQSSLPGSSQPSVFIPPPSAALANYPPATMSGYSPQQPSSLSSFPSSQSPSLPQLYPSVQPTSYPGFSSGQASTQTFQPGQNFLTSHSSPVSSFPQPQNPHGQPLFYVQQPSSQNMGSPETQAASQTAVQSPVVTEEVPKVIKLPPNWKTATDSEGNVYYYHSITRQTQWDPPDENQVVEEDEDENDEEEDSESSDTPTYDEPKISVSKHSKKKSKKKKTTKAAADTSVSFPVRPEIAKKIKELFRTKMSTFIVHCLNSYRKPDCTVGRITNNDDFKYLARKLTHYTMTKELKQCKNVEELDCNDVVKRKARDFIEKYMAKYGSQYCRKNKGSPSAT